MSNAIETVELSKTYKGGVQALTGLNMKVQQGESVGFLGPNGAGKTTTIQILLNLIRPTSGEAFLFEQDMSGQERELLQRVGALVEIPGFYDNLTVDDILQYVCKVYRLDKKTTVENIKNVLELVRLEDVRFKKLGTFSTGMRRRFGLAQVLVHDPDLIILDEPTLGMDPKGVREIRDMIREINKQGKTVFMTSHNLTEVSEISERVIFLNKGHNIGDYSIADINDMLGSRAIETKFLRPLKQEEISAISSVDGVAKFHYGKQSFLEYEGELQDTHEILKKIVNKGVPLYSFTPKTMTLEMLYLQLFNGNLHTEEVSS